MRGFNAVYVTRLVPASMVSGGLRSKNTYKQKSSERRDVCIDGQLTLENVSSAPGSAHLTTLTVRTSGCKKNLKGFRASKNFSEITALIRESQLMPASLARLRALQLRHHGQSAMSHVLSRTAASPQMEDFQRAQQLAEHPSFSRKAQCLWRYLLPVFRGPRLVSACLFLQSGRQGPFAQPSSLQAPLMCSECSSRVVAQCFRKEARK